MRPVSPTANWSVPGVTGLQPAPHFKDPGALTVVDRVGVSEHPQQAVLRPGAVVVFAGFRVGGPLVVEVAPGVVTEVPIAGARAGRAPDPHRWRTPAPSARYRPSPGWCTTPPHPPRRYPCEDRRLPQSQT